VHILIGYTIYYVYKITIESVDNISIKLQLWFKVQVSLVIKYTTRGLRHTYISVYCICI